MDFDSMEKAIREARQTLHVANSQISVMAGLCAGRLQSSDVGQTTLCKLKRELEKYNMHTGKWKK